MRAILLTSVTSVLLTLAVPGSSTSATAMSGRAGPPSAASGPGVLGMASVPAGYQLPVPGPPRVLTPFRPPAERWGAGHRGVDLAAAVGTAVRAAGAGTVAYAGLLAGRQVVSVRHTDTLRTTYEPVRPSVRAGQRVSAGEVIGTLEAGHPTCRPADCLHWGARIGADHYIDPLSLLGGRRVRLKPWDG
ncbi:M23 family metallopeptidase [Nakamurella lactea]|uniref:M23 family metallopeptidase n=1 Tax=Nakamurella lactea TaxID=459515 RepID=UPI00055B7D01|nr:M23 family metallopeptidase [Nakamurella lactea]